LVVAVGIERSGGSESPEEVQGGQPADGQNKGQMRRSKDVQCYNWLSCLVLEGT
jgi:hypothetical protein